MQSALVQTHPSNSLRLLRRARRALRARAVLAGQQHAALGAFSAAMMSFVVPLTVVTLRPKVEFAGDRQPSAAELDTLHHKAHEECFIANSVTTGVKVVPVK